VPPEDNDVAPEAENVAPETSDVPAEAENVASEDNDMAPEADNARRPAPRRPPSHSERTLRVCALYPDLMNIYADRGNLLVLERRCAWRSIGFELAHSGLGETVNPDAHELFYLGGGQDRDQRLCAEDLVRTKRAALHHAAARGAVVLGVCGGYQLLGHSYALGAEEIPGIGLIDMRTVREDGPRLIGNVAIEVDLDSGEDRDVVHMRTEPASDSPSAFVSTSTSASAHAGARSEPASKGILAGFENHGGRTYLGAGERALGRVLEGHGNDGHSGYEGVKRANVIGTYLHGPLLPKNTWFADWLIATALGMDVHELAALEDALELEAHLGAQRVAGV
jgi:lipid II isoglutaminyl synthase (glutamine-hydrolysing)